MLYKYLLILISYWAFSCPLLLNLGSAEKLYLRVEFGISVCTEKGMLNATETAVCNPSEI